MDKVIAVMDCGCLIGIGWDGVGVMALGAATKARHPLRMERQ